MKNGRPNILLIVTDQHRSDWVGMNPQVPVRTPTLSEMAEGGVMMSNAICPSPICAPSRAALATGREYDSCGVLDHSVNFPPDRETLYQRLRDEAGYHVMGCGKFDLRKASYDWGLEGKTGLREWGFSLGQDNAGKWDTQNSFESTGGPADPYMAYLDRHDLAEAHLRDYTRRLDEWPFDTFPCPIPEHAYADNFVGRTAHSYLESAPDEQPWFLQVNFSGPHDPWDVTEKMHGWYRGESAVDFPGPQPLSSDDAGSASEHTEARRNYAAMIENIDRWIERFRTVLRDNNELEDTVIVFTSDHGEFLGDRGLWRKGRPYQQAVGIPMIWSGPGIRSGRTYTAPTSLIDLYATFLEFADLAPRQVDSQSLRPVLNGEESSHRDIAYAGLGSWRLAYDGRYKLVTGYRPAPDGSLEDTMDPDAEPMLFDHTTDPLELKDVATDNPDHVARLNERITRHRTASGMENEFTR